jgi:hypothetical protein
MNRKIKPQVKQLKEHNFTGLMLRHTQNAIQHTKKNKKKFLLTNTQKNFFRAKGLIFLFAP